MHKGEKYLVPASSPFADMLRFFCSARKFEATINNSIVDYTREI